MKTICYCLLFFFGQLMCRLVVYRGFGRKLLLACLLTRPTHSIIKQSMDSKERLMSPVNGDGFGVGW
jgi:predicted glutamine amidotransferase